MEDIGRQSYRSKKNDAKRLEAIYTPAPDGIENLDLFVGKFLR